MRGNVTGDARNQMHAREQATAMTVDREQEFTIATRKTGRSPSPRIPFPNHHVHRSQSEMDLCHDKQRADQRELILFHRLVNGIRERQKKLGMVVSEDLGVLSPALMRNVPQAIRQANPLAFPPPPIAKERRSKQSWIPQTSTIMTHSAIEPAVVPQDDDEWSISGFEGHQDDESTTAHQQLFLMSPEASWEGIYQDDESTTTAHQVLDEQEGIFELDL